MPGVLYCANHPDRETLLKCNKCGQPICPQCGVRTPVGIRCRECAAVERLPTFQISPLIALRGFGAGMAAAVAASLLLGAIPILRGFLLWLSPVAGLAIGEAISLAANRKRGRALQVIAVAGVVLGTLLGNLLGNLLLGGYGINLFYVVLASVFAVIRLR